MKAMHKEKNAKKKRWIYLLCVVALALFIIAFDLILSESEAGRSFLFKSDYKQLRQVADYLTSVEYSDVYIYSPFGKMVVGLGGQSQKIENPKIRWTVFLLFLKGYDRIEKNDDKTVCFQRWSNIFGRLRGYAFSIDGSKELLIDYVVEQEEMQMENWYYYIDDYNKWREK